VANGAQLRGFPPAVMDASLKAAIEVYTDTAALNPLFKKVWDSYLPFRNDQYLWWQVAELSYDSYMVRNRNRT
jgi:TRAP-type mannitol/chloroaromatic compound transport system substrate-binding protein